MTPVCLFFLFVSLLVVSTGQEVQEESPGVSEIIEKANVGLSPSRFEHGDIRRNLNRNAVPCVAIGCKWPKRGRFVYVPFSISPEYSKNQMRIITDSLRDFNRFTCIRLIQRTWQQDQLHFYPGKGCWSPLGQQGGNQPVSLAIDGCLHKTVVQHEVLHALGFHHEHVRSDRDNYVRIIFKNIIKGKEHDFKKVETINLKTPYDFNSIMHYGKNTFSKNNLPTIIPLQNPNPAFGNAKKMSKWDIRRVNKLYGCYSYFNDGRKRQRPDPDID